ncbi:hypothetical protein [Streptomyces virginiae]|uniref:hypothetical protein n=1 Tax=Streptomyces virginiae TaxID=1961 RepID=UPI0036E247A9
MTADLTSGAQPTRTGTEAADERLVLIERWAERHGIDAARRLAAAEDLADAVAAEITPDNTTDTYVSRGGCGPGSA